MHVKNRLWGPLVSPPLCSSHIGLTVRLPFLFVLEHVCFPHSCWPISIKDRPLDSVVPSSCKEEHQQHNKTKKASGRHHLLCVAYGNGLTLSLSLACLFSIPAKRLFHDIRRRDSRHRTHKRCGHGEGSTRDSRSAHSDISTELLAIIGDRFILPNVTRLHKKDRTRVHIIYSFFCVCVSDKNQSLLLFFIDLQCPTDSHRVVNKKTKKKKSFRLGESIRVRLERSLLARRKS